MLRPIKTIKRFILLGVVITGITGGALFQPWKLFIDSTADEQFKGVNSVQEIVNNEQAPEAGGLKILKMGDFIANDHETTGKAFVVQENGTNTIRLESFQTDNGPDLKLVVTAGEVGDSDEYTVIDKLKGNVGNQNYELPANISPESVRSVVIWCKRFNIDFGSAVINPV
jgi:hypothetical protein